MRRFVFVVFVLLFLISSYLLFPMPTARAYYTGMSANIVLGQPDFTSSSTTDNGSIDAYSMNNPLGSCSDGNKLAVTTNNRVLIWNSFPTKNQQPADLVLGQPDFTTETANIGGISAQTLSTPFGCWTDGTKLFVVDQTNRRVLVWNSFPTRNQQAADVVVGQPDFATSTGAVTASKLNNPVGVLVYNGKLIVSDQTANRVLVWNTIPTTNGVAADVVVGQTVFSASSNGTLANKLFFPRSVGAYDNKLIIGDTSNHRFVIFNSIPTTNGASADVVIGQPDFSTNTSNNGGTSCLSISSPQSPYIPISNGRLFIPDGSTRRILVFNQFPSSNFQPADMVIGQSDCTSNGTGASANTFGNQPVRMGTELNGKLVVADQANSRVLIFNNTIDTPQMNINLPLEKIDNQTLRVRGNIQLGDRPNYAMQWVKADINGQGLGYVTNLGGGRDNGTSQTLYDFTNEFNPFVNGGNISNYTMKLVASSFNADQTSLFYFQPFNFDYIRKTTDSKNLNISFRVNTLNRQRMLDNVDHFEIQTSTDSGVMRNASTNSLWVKLSTNITTDKIDTNTGQVYTTVPNSLLSGIKYSVRIIAVSRDSNWQQPSNILSYFVPKKRIVK